MRFLRAFPVVLFICLLSMTPLRAAFSADEPSEDEIMESAIGRDVMNTLKAIGLRCEITGIDAVWEKTGETANILKGRVDFTTRLAEEHYRVRRLRGMNKDIQEKYGIDYSSTLESYHEADTLAFRQNEPLRSMLSEQDPPEPQDVLVAIPAGTEGPGLSYPVLAVKTADAWRVEHAGPATVRREALRDVHIRGRLTLPLFDSPETEKVIRDHVAAMQAYDVLVRKAIADDRAALVRNLAALKPGTFLTGTRGSYGIYPEIEIGILIDEADAQTNTYKGRYFEGNDRQRAKPFTLALSDVNSSLQLTVSTEDSKPAANANLKFRDGKLWSIANIADHRGELTITTFLSFTFPAGTLPVSEADRAYQSSLAAALTPGTVFSGSWIYKGLSQTEGDVSFAIESVGGDGLSCTGYLFDPADPDLSKRKAFTGVINRSVGAKNALVLTTARAGMKRSTKANPVKLTNTQSIWLVDNSSYVVTLAPENGVWTGRSSGSYLVEFRPSEPGLNASTEDPASPETSTLPAGEGGASLPPPAAAPESGDVPDAETAAPAGEDDGDYQSSLAAALTPGTVFSGSWTYRKEQGGLAFAIESVGGDGLSCTGYLFDPADPDLSRRKAFTGAINRSAGAKNALVLRAAISGVKRSTKANPVKLTTTQLTWLVDGRTYVITLAPENGVWTGRSRGFGIYTVCTLKLRLPVLCTASDGQGKPAWNRGTPSPYFRNFVPCTVYLVEFRPSGPGLNASTEDSASPETSSKAAAPGDSRTAAETLQELRKTDDMLANLGKCETPEDFEKLGLTPIKIPPGSGQPVYNYMSTGLLGHPSARHVFVSVTLYKGMRYEQVQYSFPEDNDAASLGVFNAAEAVFVEKYGDSDSRTMTIGDKKAAFTDEELDEALRDGHRTEVRVLWKAALDNSSEEFYVMLSGGAPDDTSVLISYGYPEEK